MTSSAQASRPIAAEAANGQPGERLHLHVSGARDGGEAEEHEDRQLAERPVAVRPAAAGVEPGRGHRSGAEQQQPPGGHRGQHQAGRAGDGEAAERRRQHVPRLGQAGADEPDRADPDLVRAADAVAVVVGVVDADLEGERHQQRQRGPPERELAVAERDAGADDDRHDGSREGPRSRAGHPGPQIGHCRLSVLRRSGMSQSSPPLAGRMRAGPPTSSRAAERGGPSAAAARGRGRWQPSVARQDALRGAKIVPASSQPQGGGPAGPLPAAEILADLAARRRRRRRAGWPRPTAPSDRRSPSRAAP